MDRGEGYLRTARAALDAGDWAPAFENARTACELAAKALLTHMGKETTGKQHNVARQIIDAQLWPGGEPGKRLSKFLSDYTRAVYGFKDPADRSEAQRALRMASDMIERAHKLDGMASKS
jgi:HEPN domain-containing protein